VFVVRGLGELVSGGGVFEGDVDVDSVGSLVLVWVGSVGDGVSDGVVEGVSDGVGDGEGLCVGLVFVVSLCCLPVADPDGAVVVGFGFAVLGVDCGPTSVVGGGVSLPLRMKPAMTAAAVARTAISPISRALRRFWLGGGGCTGSSGLVVSGPAGAAAPTLAVRR